MIPPLQESRPQSHPFDACEGSHGWGVLDGGIFDFEAYGFEAYGGGKMRLIAEPPCPMEKVLCA